MNINNSCSQSSSAFEKASVDDSRKSKSTQTSNSEKGLYSMLNIISLLHFNFIMGQFI